MLGISYRFRDKWRFVENRNFSHPVYPLPRWRGSPWYSILALGVKTRTMRQSGRQTRQKSLTISSAWHTIHQSDKQTDGRTDGQTDTGRQQRPRLRIASSGNNATTEPLEIWHRTLKIKPKPINIFNRCKLQTAFILVIENGNYTSPIIITITQTLMTITCNCDLKNTTTITWIKIAINYNRITTTSVMTHVC